MNNLFQRVHQFDTLAFLWLHITVHVPCRKAIRWVSRTGDGHLYAVAGLTLFLFEPEQGRAFVVAGVLAFSFNTSLYLVLKNWIKRDRPAVRLDCYQAWITPSDQFSFPSGHTAGAFLFATLMVYFYPAFALPCYGWAALVGASRVLLGVHYPSDIAAGAILGLGTASAGLYAYPLPLSWVNAL